jgi:hypothetical protein
MTTPLQKQTNPSRYIADDEPVEQYVPFQTAAEAAENQKNALEEDVLKIICTVFNLNPREICQAALRETGQYRLGIAGFQQVVQPAFPAKLTVAKPRRGKGEVLTLNRLFNNPVKFPLIADFLKKRYLESSSHRVMLIGLHPRVKQYVAVTDLLLEPDLLCFNVLIEEPEEQQQQQIVFGEFYRILTAMRNQNLWLPQIG